MRIVSLCPSNTEVVAYLGLEDLLVGVDNYSDFPEVVQKLPKVGPDLSIDLDLVEELKPDLVLASLSVPGMEKNVEGLKQRNMPFVILNPNSLKDIAADIETVGDALGRSELGKKKAEDFLGTIQRLRGRIKEETGTMYWEWWPKPVFTPGHANWLTEISELAGGENVFGDHEHASIQTDWEEVRRRNPDHICMVWVGVKEEKMNPDLLINRPGWKDITAVKEGRIYVLEEALYCRPSPRLLQGLERLVQILQ